MISICIPIYNFNVIKLVESLIEQAEKSKYQYEIICIDDSSNNEYLSLNSQLFNYDIVKYFILKENIGRSKIRNLFLKKSYYNNLLFIDCDCSIHSSKYLQMYFQETARDIVYGGRKHSTNSPSKDKKKLRWLYGIKREDQDYKFRLSNPYHSFRSNNFLIKKSVFKKIKFDEEITFYGHEDTLLSLELKKKGIEIYNINNPVFHDGIEDNIDFLKKTKFAIRNLSIIETKDVDLSFVKILTNYKRLDKLKLIFLLSVISNIGIKIIEKQLLSNRPSIILFDIYKILYYVKIKKNV